MTAAASSPPLLLLLLLLASLSVANRLTSATVVLTPAALSFPDLPAKFALAVNSHGECGALHAADPPHGCSPLRNGFQSDNGTSDVRFVLMMRGECAFEDKIRHAQNGGFRAAIVYDDKDKRNLVYMLVNPEGIKVHALFVSKLAGEILKGNARGEKGECCIYPPSYSDAGWTVLAISFISLAVILCFLMIAFVAPRPFWMYLRQGMGGGSSLSFNFRKSVDTRIVEALPQFVFCSARHRMRECLVGGETCAICLEDYQDGEVLKVLPCQHEFHSSCVVSWLTKWGTFCPVCKLDMLTNFTYSEVSEERLLLEFNFGVADVAGGMCRPKCINFFTDIIDQKGQLASESVNGLGGLPDF